MLKVSNTSMYDESVVVHGADDVQSPPSSAGISTNSRAKSEIGFISSNLNWSGDDHRLLTRELSTHSENSEEDEDDDDVQAPTIQGGYDPAEYDHLSVPEDVKDIFGFITKYIPQNVELQNKLSPFLPDLIPAVGDADTFIKVSRPDGRKNMLGLTVLDEPCVQQSDPAVLQLQLRAIAKESTTKTMVVKKIHDAEKNGKAIDKWIKAINDLHRSKPPPAFNYSKPMPNTDSLLQEWPRSVEEKLNTSIPKYDLDCNLSTYVMIICNLFDIPVYTSKVQSLHSFFTLYSTMKNTKGQLIQSQSNDLSVQ